MARKPSKKTCIFCGKAGVKKNGTTKSGAIRWRCTACGASWTNKREDITRNALMDKFVDYLMGTGSQKEVCSTGSDRTWRDKTAWCWRVEPRILVTGEIYEHIQIDGTYLPYGWCLLTAVARGKVVAWQWCNRENKAAYRQLLSRLPAPLMVITDGHGAALSAISETWPQTRVQRCLVHIKRNIRELTTSRPKLPAHQALWGLVKRLVKITSLEQADQWLALLYQFHDQWGWWLEQKTHRSEILPENIPSWVKPHQQWWYTHQNARRGYRLLAAQARKGTLFAFLDPTLTAHATQPLPSTTNALEGGTNSQIKALAYHHRGLSENHLRRAVEWWCDQHSENPSTPHQLIRPQHLKTQAKTLITKADPTPAKWDTGIDLTHADYHPDVSIRKGRAGRTH